MLDCTAEFRGIYVTLNPIDRALLSRRADRVVARLCRQDAATVDGDVLRRRWLPIDVDPVRPSGISSIDEEHDAACGTARAIGEALTGMGWPRPVIADTGNGAHLLYGLVQFTIADVQGWTGGRTTRSAGSCDTRRNHLSLLEEAVPARRSAEASGGDGDRDRLRADDG